MRFEPLWDALFSWPYLVIEDVWACGWTGIVGNELSPLHCGHYFEGQWTGSRQPASRTDTFQTVVMSGRLPRLTSLSYSRRWAALNSHTWHFLPHKCPHTVLNSHLSWLSFLDNSDLKGHYVVWRRNSNSELWYLQYEWGHNAKSEKIYFLS